ncbi:MAG: hypothetical protein IJ106_03385 [Parasporobacterium sp.]|nr:hypothetical protein [Parasporobacterium sp.]
MLDKLERKFGKYAIKNLIYYILGAYVVGYVLYMAKIEWYSYIVLDPALVMKGQVWRLITWVCTVPQSLSILLIFMFLFYYYIGRTLEQYMGSFKYNLYILSGWFFTTLGVMAAYWISGGSLIVSASTYYINLTSFLAFAVIFPDAKVLLFAIIPIKMKILAWIDAAYLGLQVISGLIIAFSPSSTVSRALQIYSGLPASSNDVEYLRQGSISLVITILISVLNFLIFFFAIARKNARNGKRRSEFARKMEAGRSAGTGFGTDPGTRGSTGRSFFGGGAAGTGQGQEGAFRNPDTARAARPKYKPGSSAEILHQCSVCGRTNVDYPDLMFRYCSKCSGNHEYCQDHLFTHEHVK